MALALVASPLSAAVETSYEPYVSGEFPQWAYELRRGETLFFGSMVITFPLVALGWEGIRALGGDLPGGNSIEVTLEKAGVASILSLGVAVTDWILGKVEAHGQT